MKDLRSLSLPNMKPPGVQSPYILAPGSEKVEHGSLGRRESIDLLVSYVWHKGVNFLKRLDSNTTSESNILHIDTPFFFFWFCFCAASFIIFHITCFCCPWAPPPSISSRSHYDLIVFHKRYQHCRILGIYLSLLPDSNLLPALCAPMSTHACMCMPHRTAD